MPSLAARRQQELTVKLRSLENELKDWEDLTSKAPFRRHYSQVRRINRTLDGLLESMKASADWMTPTEQAVLARASEWERRILTAHAIWEVFRSKLAQRFDTHFQERLAACDDLAWSCYEPAMQRFSAAKKEPPLVYLNSTWSAFLRRREATFDKDVEAGKDARETLDEADYRATVKRLPIPLLGLPWFQIAHLPSALLIAHEIGHAVEFDFDLTQTIDDTLHAASLQFDSEWRGCASEVFADLYGHLCLGRFFAGSLVDLLLADKKVIADEDTFGLYPTRAYRIELAVNALAFLGLDGQAAEIRDSWESQYGAPQKLLEYRDDAKKVVSAIYGKDGMDLAALIQPPTANVAALAQYAAQGNKTGVAQEVDARVLFCALRHAYERYPPAQSERAAQLLITQIVEKYAAVFRFRGAAVTTQPGIEVQLKTLTDDDLALGRDLARTLRLDRDQGDDPAPVP